MEEEAKRIMSSYCAGDYKAVEDAFKHMDENLVKHAVERARNLGNSAFSKGAYRQAIQYYNEALAGEAECRKHYLLSNRSACYLLLREYEQALEDARMCIRLEPKYAKGWYRAARVLFETGKYSGANAAFKASRKLETDEWKQKELDLWAERAGKHAHKAKLIDRVTVDYSRFETIEDPDIDADSVCADNDPSASGCSIEFNDKLSKEQRRQLELFLTGKVEGGSATAESARPVSYDPSTIFSKIPSFADVLEREGPRLAASSQRHAKADDAAAAEYKAKKVALEVPVALCKFLQLATEVKEPKKLADSLEEAVLPAFVKALRIFIEKFFENERRGLSPDNISWLFVGCGTCVPLVTAARFLKQYLAPAASPSGSKGGAVSPCSSEADVASVKEACPVQESSSCSQEASTADNGLLQQKPSNSRPISACTVFLSMPLKKAAEAMLERNRVDHLVNLMQQSVDKVDCAGDSADELDRATKDMTKRAQLLVIEPSLLDEALLGRQVLSYVRRARTQLCIRQPAVFPASATVFVQAFAIHLPKQAAGYDWTAVDTAARWSPYAEVMSLNVLPNRHSVSEKDSEPQYGDVIMPLSQPQAVFEFRFDGALERLDQDVPLEREKKMVLECTGSGSLNALVAWYQLRGPTCLATSEAADSKGIYSTEDSPIIVDCGPCGAERGDNLESLDVLTYALGTRAEAVHPAKASLGKQAVFWVDPIFVEKSQTLTLHASHTASRLRFRILSPRESPARIHNLAIPRYHLDLLRDTRLLELYQQAIARVAAAHLKKTRSRLRKYEQLGYGGSLSDLPPPPCLSVLCVGGAPAPLPALAGHAVATEIQKATGAAASSWQQKQADSQTFHMTVADSWPSSIKTCKKVLVDNAHLLLPHHLAPAHIIPKEEKWKPIAELTARVEGNGSATTATSKLSASSDSQKNSCNVAPGAEEGERQKAPAIDPLLKAKAKKCFTCIQKDVRQLRPPSGEEDTASLLALAELYRLPPGSDVKAHLEQAEGADPTEAAACRIHSLASLCVCGLFDNGCLGEGVLPLSKFIARVLLVKGRSTFVPAKVRISAALVELGMRTLGGIDVEIWRTYRYVPDYTSIDLDGATYTLLSEPFPVWDFDLGPASLANTSSPLFVREQKDFEVKITQDGELNAIVFWFELDIDELLTISTSPSCVMHSHGECEASAGEDQREGLHATPQGTACTAPGGSAQEAAQVRTSEVAANTEEDGGRRVHRTKAWKQAVQMLPPLSVTAASTVVVGAAHDSTKLLFRVDPGGPGASSVSETCRPLYDSSWTNLLEKQQTLSAGWMKALCGVQDSQNATHAAQATEAALRIAADAGRQHQFRIDPQEAASFALTLFY